MKTMILAALAALVVVAGGRAGWGAGGCGGGACFTPAGRFGPTTVLFGTPPFAAQPYTGWTDGVNDRGAAVKYYLRRGVRVAGYDAAAGVYRAYDAARNTWSAPQAAPWRKAAIKQCGCGGEQSRCDCDPAACTCPGCRPKPK